MMGRTHMVLGALVGTVLEAQAPGLGILEGAVIGGVAGLIPDLDHPNSTLTHKVAPIAIGSRRITMALMAVGVIAIAVKGHLRIDGIVSIAIWLLVAALSKHRGITHSLLGLLTATYTVHTWLGPHWMMVFGAAYGSHLLADMLTDGGVPLLWPYKQDFSIPTGLRTGRFFSSLFEKGVQLVSVLIIAFDVFKHVPAFIKMAQTGVQKLF